MREILSLHIGQAGAQIGNAVWELLCLEHSLCEDGTSFANCKDGNTDIFFQPLSDTKYVPRSLFIDLEPSVIDEIRQGSYRGLYHPDRMISGDEDAASNFARGFFTVGKLIIPGIAFQTRKLFESSDYVQAILMYRSLGGGTGAGLTSAMFESLSEYPKTPKIDLSIYPSASLTSSTVEPYNGLLAEHFSMEDVALGLLVDNESLYDLSEGCLFNTMPTFAAVNRLIAQIMSNITVSTRFPTVASCDIILMQSNLVPYPRIHHPLCNLAPLVAQQVSSYDAFTIKEITRTLFSGDNQFLKIDTSMGKYMSCVLCYRGNVNIVNVYEALMEVKRNTSIQFVDWCPTGFKVGISLAPPVVIPGGYISGTDKNVAMLTNTSAISQVWQRLTHKFYLLYSKRAFLHWFVAEGIEECEFTESLYNISSLVKDYEEISKPSESVPKIPRPKEKVSMAAVETNVTEVEEVKADLYVTMANGYAVSAPDRDSLASKSSLLKSNYHKPTETPVALDPIQSLDSEASENEDVQVYQTKDDNDPSYENIYKEDPLEQEVEEGAA